MSGRAQLDHAGSSLSVWRNAPAPLPGPDPAWCVVALHGVMSHAGWFAPLGEALAAEGIHLLALDRRGSGQAPAEGRFDPTAWLEDVCHAISLARATAPRVALLGWCWGARLATVAVGEHLTTVDRMILAAPGLAMDPKVAAAAAAAAATGADPVALPFSDEIFTDDPAVRRFLATDPLRWHDQPRAFLAPSRALSERARAALPRLSLPLITLLAESDRIVDNHALGKLLTRHPVHLQAGSHALILERPAEVASFLGRWLSSPLSEVAGASASERLSEAHRARGSTGCSGGEAP